MQRVFISSTSTDLTAYREIVRDAVLTLEMLPVMMEHFPAMDADAIAACKAKVFASDRFVGIYAHRYGYMPDGYAKSITHMEYEWAKEAGLPIHIFVIDPAYDWDATHYDEHQAQLAAFKAEVSQAKIWKTFTTPDSLARAVSESLTYDKDALSKHEKRQRNQVLAGFSLVVALILVGLAFFLMNAPDEEKIGVSQADRQATNAANATATQRHITPSPTPLEGQPADVEKGEIVVVVAKFEQTGGAQQEPEFDLLDVLNNAAENFENMQVIAIGHPIANREQAQQISEIYQATLVVYGRISAGGVTTSYEIKPRTGFIETGLNSDIRVAVDDVENFDIFLFDGLDVQFLLNFTLGQFAYFDQDFDQALSVFSTALSFLDENRAAELHAEYAYFYRGYTHQELKNYRDSIADYSQSINLDPAFITAYLNRGVAYTNLGEYEQAIADYNQVLQLDPQIASAYFNRGIAHANLGNFEQAITDYDQAISLQSDLDRAYYNRGVAYASLGDNEQAIANYSQAIQLNPAFVLAYNNRGNAYVNLGAYEEAIADYTHAIELDNANASAYYNRGNAHYDLVDYEEAIDDYTKAIELEPTYTAAYSNRGLAYSQLGNSALAKQDFEQAIQLNPANFSSFCLLGMANHALEEWSSAVDNLQVCVDNFGGDTTFFEAALSEAQLQLE